MILPPKDTPESGSLLNDTPCSSMDQDRLDRSGIVRGLRDAILSRTDQETMVFAIQGQWGSGKSTFLNFLSRELTAREGVVVCQFDPWWFSSTDDLIVRFFNQLQATLSQNGSDIIQKVADAVGELANVIRPISSMIAEGGTLTDVAPDSVTTIRGAAKIVSQDVWSLRRGIECLLAAASLTVVVLVDDLDRLTPQEVREVIRLVKGVSALKGLVYVIAFDPEMVSNCLSDSGGMAYLDKIVQCSIDLPLPAQWQLQSILMTALGPTLGDHAESIRWANLYNEVLSPCLSTFRDVKRYCNAVNLTFPIVRDEVDPLDFVALQAVRVFHSSVYKLLHLYTNRTQTDDRQPGSLFKSPLDFVRDCSPEEHKETVGCLLAHLFHNDPSNLLSLSRNLPAYLRLTVDPRVISNKNWHALLQNLNAGPAELIDVLEHHAEDFVLLDSILARIEILVRNDGLPVALSQNIVLAVLAAGDRILEYERPTGFSLPVPWALNRILLFAMRQIPSKIRNKLLVQGLQTAGPVVASYLFQAVEDSPLLRNVFSEIETAQIQQTLPRFRSALLSKIRKSSQGSELWGNGRRVIYLLSMWQELDKPTRAVYWLRRQVKAEPRRFVELVSYSCGKLLAQGMGDWKGRTVTEFKNEHLTGLLKLGAWKPGTLLFKARACLKCNWLVAHQREILERLIDVINNQLRPRVESDSRDVETAESQDS